MAGERARGLTSVGSAILVMAVIVVATIVAFRPFDLTVDLTDHTKTAHGPSVLASGTCDAAATTAWNRDSKGKVALWAVTVGTNMMGYTPVFGKNVKYVLLGRKEIAFPGPYCAGEARHRLLVAGTVLVGGVLVVVGGMLLVRRRRVA
jgi:hypothetical protein